MSVGDVPTVFIIDDDSGVRESIKDLVESVGLHAESFATAQQFLSGERRGGQPCGRRDAHDCREDHGRAGDRAADRSSGAQRGRRGGARR